MTTSRRGRGLLAVTTAVSAATVLAVTAAGGATAAQTAGPGEGKGKAAQSENASGKERKGNYDARTPSAKITNARAAKVAGKETAASEKFRNSLGTQGVVELDPNTGTPAQVTKLNGFLTGKSAKKAPDVALGYVKAHPEVFKLSDADLATLKLRKDYVDDLGTHHVSWSQVVDGVEVFGNGLKANVTKNGQLISVMGSPVSGLTAPGRGRRGRAEGDRRRGPHRGRRGHRRYGEVRHREDVRRQHPVEQRRHREAGVVPHRRRAAQGLADLRQRRRHEDLQPRHRRPDRRPALPQGPGQRGQRRRAGPGQLPGRGQGRHAAGREPDLQQVAAEERQDPARRYVGRGLGGRERRQPAERR